MEFDKKIFRITEKNGEYKLTKCLDESLETVVIPEGVNTIGKNAFLWHNMKKLLMPNSVTKLEAGAFMCCKKLEEVVLSQNLSSVAGTQEGAFASCVSLRKVELPGSLKKVGPNMFVHCENLEEVSIAEGVTGLGNECFAGCPKLERVSLPESLTQLGYHVFANSYGIPYLRLGKNVKSICGGALPQAPGLRLDLDPNNKYYHMENGQLTDKNATLIYCCSPTTVSSCTLNEGIKSIEHFAFAGNQIFQEILLPASLTGLTGEGSFRHSAIKRMVLPDTITGYIPPYSFSNCKSLESFTVSANVTAFGRYALSGCDAMKDLYLRPVVPPVCNEVSEYWYSWMKDATIHVPASALDAYRNSAWGFYKERMVADIG